MEAALLGVVWFGGLLLVTGGVGLAVALDLRRRPRRGHSGLGVGTSGLAA